VIKKVEREHILATLKKANWSRAEAAKLLEVDSKTLYNKMKEYNIEEP
jgi:two-component system, NtrC family, response regulator HydG